ncbi:MAG: site-specific integrase [Nitrospinota bacterium]
MRRQLPNPLARALRGFFADYLPRLRGMSPHTIQSYRDSIVLFLRFLGSHRGHRAAAIDFEHIGTQEIIAFLDHLEQQRGNKATTRNVRLAALHAFFRFIAAEYPDRLEQAQRILAIPFKRARSRPVDYFEYVEIEAVFAAVDRSTPTGRRDYALLATLFNTGARVQELLDLRAHDLQLVRPFQVRLFGKGRRERLCPLWPQTAQILRNFCDENQLDLRSNGRVFLNHRRQPLTRFGVRYILAKYLDRTRKTISTLAKKRLHPHCVRHSTAVHLLKSGVDLVTISQWLGHASINTTNRYATIDLEMKREAIARARPLKEHPQIPPPWRSDAAILAWLEDL